MMKTGLLAGAFMLMAGMGFAQKIQVKETEMDVNGIPRIGQQIRIQLDSKVVEKAWEKELEANAGKVKTSKGVATVDRAELKPVSKTPIRILSTVSTKPEGTFVWWAVDLGNSYVSKDATPDEYAAAEEFLKGFARKLYREDVQKQIAEAEKVLSSTQAEEARVVKKAEDIKASIEKNRQRKKEL
ncbi:MAG: DNA repair ATPase [Hymenobacteraceae bacterium]|nr:DNA repair ATPase [Hymenobacteraceae bacterium]MDX5395197.1 DNA repair ATPase [Hymenobacteraceae bacterium]MDX5511235.1 DNA repair ATPase [Hymenobacteraceae bacterium]